MIAGPTVFSLPERGEILVRWGATDGQEQPVAGPDLSSVRLRTSSASLLGVTVTSVVVRASLVEDPRLPRQVKGRLRAGMSTPARLEPTPRYLVAELPPMTVDAVVVRHLLFFKRGADDALEDWFSRTWFKEHLSRDGSLSSGGEFRGSSVLTGDDSAECFAFYAD